jgi:tetratricopeptide (TPR) repeat protein
MPKQALELYDDTLAALAERSPDAKPPVYLAVNRGRALETVGRLREAQAAHESALKIAVDSKHTIGQVQALAGLAAVAIQLRDTTAAAAYLDRTSAVLGSTEAADKTPKVALIRGRLALALGHVAEARRRFEGVAAASSSKATAADAEIGKAEAMLIAGDAAAAAESARVALDASLSLQSGLPFSQRVGRASLLLGRALKGLGKSTEAQEAFASAVTNLSNSVDESHPALIEARELSGQRLKP